MLNFCNLTQQREERNSRTFTSFDVKLDVLHRDLDRSSFDAQGTVEQFVVFVWQFKSGLWPRLYHLHCLDETEVSPRGPKLIS